MSILHPETLARYQQLTPDQFLKSVLMGTLRDHLYMAYNVITVYAQILSKLPLTENLYLSPIPNNVIRRPIELREVMRRMEACVIEANNLIQLPIRDQQAEQDILRRVQDLRKPIEHIDRWAAAIEGDTIMKTIILSSLRGKSASRIASEIREYMFDTNQVLIFAQVYALRWRRRD